jgi:hypothetical protein
MRKELWLENLERGDHAGDLGADTRLILKWAFGKKGVRVSTGFVWHRIEVSGEVFRTRSLVLQL